MAQPPLSNGDKCQFSHAAKLLNATGQLAWTTAGRILFWNNNGTVKEIDSRKITKYRLANGNGKVYLELISVTTCIFEFTSLKALDDRMIWLTELARLLPHPPSGDAAKSSSSGNDDKQELDVKLATWGDNNDNDDIDDDDTSDGPSGVMRRLRSDGLFSRAAYNLGKKRELVKGWRLEQSRIHTENRQLEIQLSEKTDELVKQNAMLQKVCNYQRFYYVSFHNFCFFFVARTINRWLRQRKSKFKSCVKTCWIPR